MNYMTKIAGYEAVVERRLEKSCERNGWIASAHVSFAAWAKRVYIRLTKPYGDGLHVGMLLRFNSESVNKYVPNWATMEVLFTNNPYAGFYVLPKDGFSEMKCSYNAYTNMHYQATRTFRMGRLSSDKDILDENSYMVFRTRTTVDDKGRLVSAHYGKIYGPWLIWRNTRARMMFFNTTPNDTNLEDMATYKESESRERD